jgi:cytolysin (calcineurin-like family phosphatase)
MGYIVYISHIHTHDVNLIFRYKEIILKTSVASTGVFCNEQGAVVSQLS